MNRHSITFRLIVGGLLAVLVPLVIVGWFSMYKSSAALTQLSKQNALLLADSTAEIVDKIVDGARNLSVVMAAKHSVFSAVEMVNRDGMEAASAELELVYNDLTLTAATFKSFEAVFLTDKNGQMISAATGDGKMTLENISDREYFEEIKRTGAPVVSNIILSKISNDNICVIAAPVKSESGEFQGVIGMIMNAEELFRPVDERTIGKTGYLFMTDANGIIVAHPDKNQVLTLDISKLPGMEGISDKMKRGEKSVEEYVYKGVDKIAAIAPVAGTPWRVAASQVTSEFLESVKAQRNATLIISAVSMVLVGLLILFAARGITGPINRTVAGLKDAAEGEGDLTMRLPVTSKDEIGELATWFNLFIEKLQKVIGEITNNAVKVGNSSTDLTQIAKSLASAAGDASGRANNVAAATEELNVNMSNVAAAMEQSTTNTSIVADSAEQMNKTIQQIAGNVQEASTISRSAVSQAEDTASRMKELGDAAEAIGKVTATITEISEQTNLLALNATIEAARAGEAGKGFNVVANEIKELAKQTAEATMDIRNQIDGVQHSTSTSISAINEILQIINKINDIVGKISESIEEQAEATREIAENINHASQGLTEVNENISQSSEVSRSIAEDIAQVNNASGAVADQGRDLTSQASALSDLAVELKKILNSFKI